MSNVVPLFRSAPSKQADKPNILSVVSCITDWAEASGVDIQERDFQIRCADIMTLLQIMVNESAQAKVA